VSPFAGRTLTLIAAAVLAFDGAALGAAGLWTNRIMLSLIGLVIFLSSGVVLLSWRWYRRRLEEIASARSALRDEVKEMQRLLRRGER
jgi:hypothetical protein